MQVESGAPLRLSHGRRARVDRLVDCLAWGLALRAVGDVTLVVPDTDVVPRSVGGRSGRFLWTAADHLLVASERGRRRLVDEGGAAEDRVELPTLAAQPERKLDDGWADVSDAADVMERVQRRAAEDRRGRVPRHPRRRASNPKRGTPAGPDQAGVGGLDDLIEQPARDDREAVLRGVVTAGGGERGSAGRIVEQVGDDHGQLTGRHVGAHPHDGRVGQITAGADAGDDEHGTRGQAVGHGRRRFAVRGASQLHGHGRAVEPRGVLRRGDRAGHGHTLGHVERGGLGGQLFAIGVGAGPDERELRVGKPLDDSRATPRRGACTA